MAIQQVCVAYLIRPVSGGTEVLLGRKLTGLGAGKVVAPGGKLEVGESAEQAIKRELAEEVGSEVSWTSLRQMGLNRYRFPTRPSWHQDSHVFTARWAGGQPEKTSELDPFWSLTTRVPYEDMWADARSWLPAVLRGEACDGDFTFGADLESLISIRAG